MEGFEKVIRRRIWLFTVMGICAVILGIYDVFGTTLLSSEEGAFLEGAASGSTLGLILAMGALSLVQVIRLRKVLGDERALKLLYNKEHDERVKAIKQKTGMPVVLIMPILMIVVSLIASQYNQVVFYTLYGAASVQLLFAACLKIYYMKTM